MLEPPKKARGEADVEKRIAAYFERLERTGEEGSVFSLCAAAGLTYDRLRCELRASGKRAESLKKARDRLCGILEERGKFDKKTAGGAALFALLEDTDGGGADSVTIIIRPAEGDDGKDYLL